MPRGETRTARRARAAVILERLERAYPDARTELEFRTPFELLIATILSAQATDRSVNAAAPALFARFPDAVALAAAEPPEVEPLVRRIGLYRTKARHIVATARQLVSLHGGEVPDDFDAVRALPGVGRKTANVVLSNAYGRPAIAVDTHVSRLSRRLGFSLESDPDKVERDLQGLFPEGRWTFLHHALILHGRRLCTARKPACESCPLLGPCPRIGVA